MRIVQLTSENAGEVLRSPYLYDEPPDREAVRDYLGDDRNIFLMAYDGERPVGFVRGTALRQTWTRRRQMFLYEISVEDAFRRRGIGKSLIEELIRHCRELDCTEVFVFTDDPANVAAEGLYRSTGAITETAGERMFVYRL